MEKKGAEDKYSGNKAGNKTEGSSISTQRDPNTSKQRRGSSGWVILQQKKLLPVGIPHPKQWHSRNLSVPLLGKRALDRGGGEVSLCCSPTGAQPGALAQAACAFAGAAALLAAGPIPSKLIATGTASPSPEQPQPPQFPRHGGQQGAESCCWHHSTATVPGTAQQSPPVTLCSGQQERSWGVISIFINRPSGVSNNELHTEICMADIKQPKIPVAALLNIVGKIISCTASLKILEQIS